MFSDVDIERLPKVAEAAIKSALAEPAIWIPIHLRCELCKTDSVRAAVCCADCKRRFCRKHADVSCNDQKFLSVHYHRDKLIHRNTNYAFCGIKLELVGNMLIYSFALNKSMFLL